MFTLGVLDLPDKAKIEDLYWQIGRDVVESFKARLHAGGNTPARRQPGRPVSLQFFRFSVAARSLGARSVVSHHADCPPE